MTSQEVLLSAGIPISGGRLHDIFESQADARPDAVAVVFGAQEITYLELDRRANQLARHLRSRGVKRGSAVAMLLERAVEAYVALLAILKAGAAYVPIDPAYPAERIDYILADSSAVALVTRADLAATHAAFPGAVVRIDNDSDQIAAESTARIPEDDNYPDPGDLCYLIYTSGSTGRPKGVMVEHRNACHLVRAEGRIFSVRPEDRVYQGASLAFDLSVEEIWLAFHAGATLIAATPEIARAGPDLGRRFTSLGVTVVSCVPTLLSMLDGDLPGVRLIILGGETCSNQLVARWASPGRRIVNTYGPTETTVIATYTDLYPEKPVTIGRPVPGYRVHILDDDLRPVRHGQKGEICVGGPGVARGYMGLPAETQLKFVADPFAGDYETGARLYRTGDLGRIDREGNLHFLGRADSQVKLRGLRVELSEIEAVLLEAEDVLGAACAVHEIGRGVPHLVGYVVPRKGHTVDKERLAAHLRRQLPAWMVPAILETVSDLPRLTSGKLDRASLPAPRSRTTRQPPTHMRIRTHTESRLAEVWNHLFRPLRASLDDDFFLNLGGHSLLAAQMVSELRKDPRYASLTVADVYKHPTISRLAAAIDAAASPADGAPADAKATACQTQSNASRERSRHFMAGLIQSASLYFVFAFQGLPIAPYLAWFLLAVHHSLVSCAAWAAAIAMVVFPVQVLIAVSAKWLLLGRIRPGCHPLWGGYYLRWWFVETLVKSVPLTRLGGTPWLPFVYRLLGARIGSGVHIATDHLSAFDLISIGDGASVDEGASLLGYAIENGQLVVGPVCIGHRCFVGARAVLCGHTAMGDGARLEDLSMLPAGARLPAGETWAGSPPRRVRNLDEDRRPEPVQHSRLYRRGISALYAAMAFLFPLIELVAFLPGIAILTHIHPAQGLFYLAVPLAGASFIGCLMTQVVVLKWLLIGRARAGRYPLHGWFYLRHWVVEQLLALSVDVAGPLHATLYLKPWYCALGARMGRFVELSTANTTTPDLLEIQDGGTVADEVSLASARVEAGWLTLAPIRLGRRAFVGNSAVIPAGTTLGDDSLVGVLTIAPPGSDNRSLRGASWLGSPPIPLPRRQPSACFSEERTFGPGRMLQWARACCEIPRVTLPGAGFILVTVATIETALKVRDAIGTGTMLGCLPAFYAACCGAAIVVVAAVKWIAMGRYEPFERPLWSLFLWRLEFVNALFEFLATPIALEALEGTPLLPWYLRLLGARIGSRVYMGTTGFLEFDLVEVGDGAILNKDCILQTHLFEDRILKGSRLRIGAGCEIGAHSVVLYNSEMRDGAKIGPLSLLMKGETLPGGTEWLGSPLSAAVTTADIRC